MDTGRKEEGGLVQVVNQDRGYAIALCVMNERHEMKKKTCLWEGGDAGGRLHGYRGCHDHYVPRSHRGASPEWRKRH